MGGYGQAVDANWSLEALLEVPANMSFPFQEVFKHTAVMGYATKNNTDASPASLECDLLWISAPKPA